MLDIYTLTPILLCYEALDASAPMKGETLDIPFSEAFIVGQPGCPHTWTTVYPIHVLHILEGKVLGLQLPPYSPDPSSLMCCKAEVSCALKEKCVQKQTKDSRDTATTLSSVAARFVFHLKHLKWQKATQTSHL